MDSMEVLAGLSLPGSKNWGAVATDWQIDDARSLLDPDGVDLHFWTRPRGASKTTDLAGCVLAALLSGLIGAGEVGYAFAADRDQARLLLDAVRGFVVRTNGVAALVHLAANSIGSSVHGGRFEVMASDGPSAYGLTPKMLVVDEVAQWPDTAGTRELWTAIVSSQSKRPARMVMATTAGDPAHFSFKVLEEARLSERWRVSEVPGPSPFIDQDALADQRKMLPPTKYEQLHLNRWVTPEERLADLDALRRCVRSGDALLAKPGVRYVMGLDVGLKNDRTVLAVVHRDDADALATMRTPDELFAVGNYSAGYRAEARLAKGFIESPRFVVDRLVVWKPSRKDPVDLVDVQTAVVETSRRYNGASLVFDPYQAIQLAQNVQAAGIFASEFTFSATSVGRLALPLFRAIHDEKIEFPDDEDLLDELAHVTLRESSSGTFRLDHPSGRHDDMAIAIALAMSDLVKRPVQNSAVHNYLNDWRRHG